MFNYQAILAQITGLLKGLYITNIPGITSMSALYLSSLEKRLAALAKNTVSGDLSKDEVLEALTAEWDILKSELNSFEQLGLTIAQGTINDVQGVFSSILLTSIRGDTPVALDNEGLGDGSGSDVPPVPPIKP